tara:strand:+ start:417 stop:614 length:198 start_codon:yes stop_codon:yes gene_type:complete
MNKFLEKFLLGTMLKSKKFWYTMAGIVTTFLSDTFGLEAEQVNNILMSIGALVLGQGISDSKDKK